MDNLFNSVIGCLFGGDNILESIPTEQRAFKLLSENEDFSVYDVVTQFNKINSKLGLDIIVVRAKEIESEYYILGLKWQKIPDYMTKNLLLQYIRREITRFLHVDCSDIDIDIYSFSIKEAMSDYTVYEGAAPVAYKEYAIVKEATRLLGGEELAEVPLTKQDAIQHALEAIGVRHFPNTPGAVINSLSEDREVLKECESKDWNHRRR